MLPYIVAVIAFVALALSLHKERLLAPEKRSIFRAIRLHHVAQIAVVAMSLWVAVDSDREAKRLRIAHLDAGATAAAAKHAVPILDLYFLRLLPAASTLKNYSAFSAALDGTHLSKNGDYFLQRAAPQLAQQRESAVSAFNELQRIARTILAESAVYGDRYPPASVAWAERTLKLKESDLPMLLGQTSAALEYAELTGNSVGFSTGAAREALSRIER
jgi:hypothetical protein